MKAKNKTANKTTRIMIVDDHPIVRYGITRILSKEEDLQVCGEAEDGHDALQLIDKLKPDLVILDITLKRIDGLKLAKIIHTDHPAIPVLILSMHDESVYAARALRAGARGYIMKEESSDHLVPAVRQILRGEVYASDLVKKQVLNSYTGAMALPRNSPVEVLSDRERQVFLLLGQVPTSRLIAEKLSLSIKTIETHRSRIKLKLGIEHNHQLLLAAAQWSEREGIKPPLIA